MEALPSSSTQVPTTLQTARLILRLADPHSTEDCQQILDLYTQYHARSGTQPSIRTLSDVHRKHDLLGPKPELCTLVSPPPRGMFLLIYLKPATEADNAVRNDTNEPIGHIGLSFRAEMPCPDFGYAVLTAHEGKGYVSEAGREALRFWRDVVGVREMFIGTSEENVKSQKVAERMGFVDGGNFEIEFAGGKRERAKAFVLPGMGWREGCVLMHDIRRE